MCAEDSAQIIRPAETVYAVISTSPSTLVEEKPQRDLTPRTR